MEDWQTLDDDDVKPVASKPVPAAAVNKWAGEDEDDVKDSWDAEEEDEKKDEEKIAPAPSKKKTLNQKIAERERQAQLEAEQKAREKEEESLTPEERRRREIQRQEADTLEALSSLGIVESGLETSMEELKTYAEAFSRRVTEYKKKDDIFPILEELVKSLCAGMSSTNIRKIKTGLDVLHTEKVKLEKADKNKKKPGAKAAGKLRVERDDDYSSRAGAFEADDYDDFM